MLTMEAHGLEGVGFGGRLHRPDDGGRHLGITRADPPRRTRLTRKNTRKTLDLAPWAEGQYWPPGCGRAPRQRQRKVAIK